MKRIDTSTKATDLFGAGKHGFRNSNLPLGVAATDFNADWPNNLQEEIARVVEAAGIVLDGAVFTQLLQALRSNSLVCAVDTGAANAVVLTYTPAISSLVDGMVLWFKAKAANTGVVTLNVNGLGASPLVGAGNVALQGGEVVANGKCLVVWDATISKWVLIACTGGALQVAAAVQSSHATQAAQIQTSALINGVDTGAANACLVTYAPAPAALTDGMVLWFKAAAANTGATTLNVNGLGAKPVVGGGQVALQGGEIVANGKCMVVYSTTLSSFVLIECTGAALQVAASTQPGHAVQRNQATIGATVRNVNGSRSLGVTYTNSTSRFMWVYISAIASTAGSAALSATVAGIGYIGSSTNGATALSGFIAFPVPPGASYQVNTATGSFSAFNNWVEVS
ncbi:hypothetical protein [Variovorax gossypii]